MRRASLLVAVVGLVSAIGPAQRAQARDFEKDSAALRALHRKLAPSVVQVDAVARSFTSNGVEIDSPKSFFGVVTSKSEHGAIVIAPGEFFDDGSALDAHVATVTVRVAGGAEFPGEFLAQDAGFAFIRVIDPAFPGEPAAFATDDAVAPGDFVATVRLAGESFGHVAFIDAFLVSAEIREPRCFVSTFGLSDSLGAPVAAFDGRVIGVVGMVALAGGGGRRDPTTGERETSLFAPTFGSDPDAREVAIVPVSGFRARLKGPPAIAPQPVDRPWLGVELQVLLPEVRRLLGLPDEFRAALVTRVLPDSPAARVGIAPLDLITAFDGVPLECLDERDLRGVKDRLAAHRPGDPLRVDVRRGAERLELGTVLDFVPGTVGSAETADCESLGVSARDLVYADRVERGLPNDAGGAVLTAVKPAGLAGLGGARVGDLVQRVNDREVRGARELRGWSEALFAEGGIEIVLFVRRGAETRFVRVENR